MNQRSSHVSRKRAGEEVVSVIVQQALLAGATIEQLENKTGRNRDEIQRLLARLNTIEEITRDLDAND